MHSTSQIVELLTMPTSIVTSAVGLRTGLVNMYADFVCDECKSDLISPDGYCMKCGVFVLDSDMESTFSQWITGTNEDEYSSRDMKIKLPWIESGKQVFQRMLDYPEAIEFVESKLRTSWQEVNLGDTIKPPARMWYKPSWNMAVRQLVERKCVIPTCFKMTHLIPQSYKNKTIYNVHDETYRMTRTRLCFDHLRKYHRAERKESRHRIRTRRKNKLRGCRNIGSFLKLIDSGNISMGGILNVN
jgi:hypothetical protein